MRQSEFLLFPVHIVSDIDRLILRAVFFFRILAAVHDGKADFRVAGSAHPRDPAVIGKIRKSAALIITHSQEVRLMKNRVFAAKSNAVLHKLSELRRGFRLRPAHPARLIVLAPRIVIAVLRIHHLIPGIDHRGRLPGHQHKKCIPEQLHPEFFHGRFTARALGTTVPGEILRCAVTVIFSVSLVVLLAVAHHVIHREPVLVGKITDLCTAVTVIAHGFLHAGKRQIGVSLEKTPHDVLIAEVHAGQIAVARFAFSVNSLRIKISIDQLASDQHGVGRHGLYPVPVSHEMKSIHVIDKPPVAEHICDNARVLIRLEIEFRDTFQPVPVQRINQIAEFTHRIIRTAVGCLRSEIQSAAVSPVIFFRMVLRVHHPDIAVQQIAGFLRLFCRLKFVDRHEDDGCHAQILQVGDSFAHTGKRPGMPHASRFFHRIPTHMQFVKNAVGHRDLQRFRFCRVIGGNRTEPAHLFRAGNAVSHSADSIRVRNDFPVNAVIIPCVFRIHVNADRADISDPV